MVLERLILEQERKEGLKEGMENGFLKGIEKGIFQTKIQVILNGFDNHLDIQMLANITEYPDWLVEAILSQYKKIK